MARQAKSKKTSPGNQAGAAKLARLRAPEKKLVTCVKRGERCVFDKSAPEKTRTIRAEVIERLVRGQHLPGETVALDLPPKGLVITGAKIVGALDLSACDCPARLVFFECKFDTQIDLRDARLRGLSLVGSSLNGLRADGLTVEGLLNMRDIRSSGAVRFLGATITGDLSLLGATLENTGKGGAVAGDALSLDRAQIGGSAFLDEGFSAKGAVRLLGATITGNLSLRGATLENTDKDGAAAGYALSLDRAQIGGSAFLDEGFSAKGAVRLPGADITGNLSLSDATLENTDKDGAAAGYALSLSGAKIGGNAFLNEGFSAKGELRFLGANITGVLDLRNSTLEHTNKDGVAAGHALNCQKLTVSGICFFEKLAKQPIGDVDLRGMTASDLTDDGSLWPEDGHGDLWLDAFTYKRFVACETEWQFRKDWLLRQTPVHLKLKFAPQPWVQCAKVLREMGHERDARLLLFQMHEARRRALPINWRKPHTICFWKNCGRWLGSQMLRWTAGHGYRPGWSLVWIAGIIFIGAIIFSSAQSADRMTPAKERFYLNQARMQEYELSGVLPAGYPDFSPFIYSVDVFLPIVSFSQEEHWRPATLPLYERLKPWSWNWYRIYNRLHIILGWIFTSIAVLAFTGAIKRD